MQLVKVRLARSHLLAEQFLLLDTGFLPLGLVRLLGYFAGNLPTAQF
jgi:hypothetical protein